MQRTAQTSKFLKYRVAECVQIHAAKMAEVPWISRTIHEIQPVGMTEVDVAPVILFIYCRQSSVKISTYSPKSLCVTVINFTQHAWTRFHQWHTSTIHRRLSFLSFINITPLRADIKFVVLSLIFWEGNSRARNNFIVVLGRL